MNELENVADTLREIAAGCLDCDYGKGATGKTSEGDDCEECAPERDAERRARAAAVKVQALVTAATQAEAVLARGNWLETSTDPEAVALRALRAAIAKATVQPSTAMEMFWNPDGDGDPRLD